MDAPSSERRRGTALEEALLTAAWDELFENGFADLTLEGVAKRAGTSRPVIRRRWSSRAELAKSAITHRLSMASYEAADLGNVRDELVGLMKYLSETRAPLVLKLLLGMSEYFEETDSNLADLRAEIAGRGPALSIIERGIARGELNSKALTPRIVALPFDLLRNEMMMTFKPVPEPVITEILDEIFLPLVAKKSKNAK